MYFHDQCYDAKHMTENRQKQSNEVIEDRLRESLEVLIDRDNPMAKAAKTTLDIYG
jgi:hypothetical protein